jgi:hypothetical protein
MKILEDILNKILLRESVSINDVEDAIDNHKRVIINYHTKGEDKNTGARVIEVYAYGLTKAGNPVIRCFQPYGDSTTRVPSWKFFRLDRISAWQPTEQTFSRPADFYYKGLGEFNPNGDETMSVVYKIAQFGNENNIEPTQDNEKSQPKTKQDVFKTDTENRMERLRQNLQNPITLDDIKKGDAFKQINANPSTQQKTGPKTKQDVYKTDSEKELERKKQQIQNPQKIDLSRFNKPNEKSQEEKEKELEKLRQTLSDKPMSLADLYDKMKQETKPEDDRERRIMRRRDNRWEKAADTRYLGNRKGSLNRAFDEET